MLSRSETEREEAQEALAAIELGAAYSAVFEEQKKMSKQMEGQREQHTTLHGNENGSEMVKGEAEIAAETASTRNAKHVCFEPGTKAGEVSKAPESENQPLSQSTSQQTPTDDSAKQAGDSTSNRKLKDLLMSMLNKSIAAYVLAYGREKAKEGIALFDELLQLPITMEAIFRVFFQEEEAVKTMLAANPLTAVDVHNGSYQLTSIFEIHDTYAKRGQGDSGNRLWPSPSHEQRSKFVVVEAGDEHQKTELVYFIALDHFHKEVVSCTTDLCLDQRHTCLIVLILTLFHRVRCTPLPTQCVFFRGSVNAKDWGVNLDPEMKVIENPIGELRESFPTLKAQDGFCRYLFDRPKITPQKKPKGKRDEISVRKLESIVEVPSKADFIIGQVEDLLTEYPDYKITVTGHSLGGSIAHIFASWAACRATFPKPITCVTFGGPKAGNVDFRRAVHWLESHGQLRLLRVVNADDPIPRAPVRAYKNDYCCFCHISNIYTQVGPRLELGKGKTMKLSFGRPFYSRRNYLRFIAASYLRYLKYFAWWFTAGGFGYVAFNAHGCITYYHLLQEQSDALEQLTLDNIYTIVLDCKECNDAELKKKLTSLLTITQHDDEN
jgi:hypothetical protein